MTEDKLKAIEANLRDALLDAMQFAVARSRRHRRSRRDDFETVLDVVLDEVRRQVLPVVEREWCGGAVIKVIDGLRGA